MASGAFPTTTKSTSTSFTSSMPGKCAVARILGIDGGTLASLSSRQWRVLVACLHFARRTDGSFWPSLATLGKVALLNRQETCRARTALRRIGIMSPSPMRERIGRAGGGVAIWRFNHWQTNVAAPVAAVGKADVLRAIGHIKTVVTGDNGLLSAVTTVPLLSVSLPSEEQHQIELIREPSRPAADENSTSFVKSPTAEQTGMVVKGGTSEPSSPAYPTPTPAVPTTPGTPDDTVVRQVASMLRLRGTAQADADRLAHNAVLFQRRRGWRDRSGAPLGNPIMATVGLIERNAFAFAEPTPQERTRIERRTLAAHCAEQDPATPPMAAIDFAALRAGLSSQCPDAARAWGIRITNTRTHS